MTPSSTIVAAARAAQEQFRIPASVSIAQFALESGWGAHMPPNSNNPFGMKCRAGRNDPSVVVHTREVDRYGHDYFVAAAFRKFASVADAFIEHARLLATAPVYAPAFAKLPDVAAFVSAMALHYATDPRYAALIMGVIHGSNLTQYDSWKGMP